MTDREIEELMAEFRVPPHVQRHCKKVAELAYDLALRFNQKGHSVDAQAVREAGLVHDFVRVVDFRALNLEGFSEPPSAEDMTFWSELRSRYEGQHHADVGAQILRARGYEKIATIVKKHKFLQIVDGFDSWEEKLVYYADKRVKHDQVVSLKDRIEDGRRRNRGHLFGTQDSEELDKKVFALEAEIRTVLGHLQ